MREDYNAKTLEALAPGQSGTISSVGGSDGAVKRRLIDMGLTPGTSVHVKKIAPFGDPIEVRIRGYELSLRKTDAANIFLTETPIRKRERRSAKTSYPQIGRASCRERV